jgi:RNA polymerase sigma-70 factor (ECF subfamily)
MANPEPSQIDPEQNAAVVPMTNPSLEPAIPSRSHGPAVLNHETASASSDAPSHISPDPAVSAFPDLPSAGVAAPAPSLSAIEPSSGLTLEARGLSMVQQALRDGMGAEALALLDQQDRTFRGGKLDLERQAARIIALCAVGRQAEARTFAARFLARAPSSFLAARVRNTCAGR